MAMRMTTSTSISISTVINLNAREFRISNSTKNLSTGTNYRSTTFHSSFLETQLPQIQKNKYPRISRHTNFTLKASMETSESLKHLLFVEMGVGYDQHGQDVTKAAMKACKDAISSNSIPAFSIGSIPGVSKAQMKLLIKLGVPRSLQQSLDIEKVKSVFPYGKILDVEVVDGGLICSSGVHVEELGDKNDDCYVVNAAVYVGY